MPMGNEVPSRRARTKAFSASRTVGTADGSTICESQAALGALNPARGTILWVFTDGQKSIMAVEPEFGFTEGSSPGVWRQ